MPFLSVPTLLCPTLEKLNSLQMGFNEKVQGLFFSPQGFFPEVSRALCSRCRPGCGQGPGLQVPGTAGVITCTLQRAQWVRKSLQQPRLPPGLLSTPPCSQGFSHAGPSQMSWLLSLGHLLLDPLLLGSSELKNLAKSPFSFLPKF